MSDGSVLVAAVAAPAVLTVPMSTTSDSNHLSALLMRCLPWV